MSDFKEPESNQKYGKTPSLKKMMKHIKKSLSLKKGGNGNLPSDQQDQLKPTTEKPNSIFSYMKHFMDSVFDRENFLKKQREEQLNGIKEPYDTTMANLANIKPVDIGPAVAYEEFVKSVEKKENEDDVLKEIQEQPENLEESKRIIEDGKHIQSAAVENIENIKQGILENLKSVTERLQVVSPTHVEPQEQSTDQQPIIELARPLVTYEIDAANENPPSLKKSNFLK